ncbi:uncharacterized protein LOC133201158 [Saccostrea echinata]|uniref:uncharacterized protein LOC133201158 n=1 Tax=Saccostrea echinata TaxID=191078 RepID=UPI002A82FC12|nr:uncharacterized protein LOC133201158 [Saccostrea echinata]
MVKFHLTLLLFALLTSVEPQSPKIPDTQLSFPPIGLGVTFGDSGPEGIIKIPDKNNSPVTAWASSNFRGKVGGGLNVKTPNLEITGEGSVDTDGRWDASLGVKMGKFDITTFGRDAGRGVEVGVGVDIRFRRSFRERTGAGGGGRKNFQRMVQQRFKE